MPGTMSLPDIVADFKLSLNDSAKVFIEAGDVDFIRHVTLAALDMGRVRPRTLLGNITLVADQNAYAAPADMLSFKAALWGNARRAQPWEKAWTGKLPDARLAMNGLVRELHLQPPPTSQQITVLGSTYKFYYFAGHVVGAAAVDTSILAGDRGLLILRAQAEACKELAMRNITKPASMRDGISNQTSNGTPAYLWEQLMKQFEGNI